MKTPSAWPEPVMVAAAAESGQSQMIALATASHTAMPRFATKPMSQSRLCPAALPVAFMRSDQSPRVSSDDVQSRLRISQPVESLNRLPHRQSGARLGVQAFVNPIKDAFKDTVAVLPVQQQMRRVGKEGPFLLARQSVVESADAANVQNVVLSASHREDGNAHMFGLVDSASRQLEEAEQHCRPNVTQNPRITEQPDSR